MAQFICVFWELEITFWIWSGRRCFSAATRGRLFLGVESGRRRYISDHLGASCKTLGGVFSFYGVIPFFSVLFSLEKKLIV